ncbi:MAG: hypothetical protein E6J88_18600 [Deltaproteobacteria bacterium]|nr:MAG: hypothetical protein E6J88_18600 [Deltaproteobacteria bacterium]
MGIGHLAVGFAAKRAVPRVPLGVLLLASIFADALWGAFLLLGLEHARVQPGATAASPLDLYDFPISHSLLGEVLWALLFGGAFFAFKKYRAGAVMLGAIVISHWFLDVIAHRPDMPVFLKGPYLGLGLWNSVPASIIVEEAMLAAGVYLYLKATTGDAKTGLAIVVGVLAIMGVAGYVSPPPPSLTPVAISNLALSIVVFFVANAIDRRRVVRPAPAR